ncbi:hypothetical protein POTOM_044002 [Populus tomentosa]|uniref:Uncharacterized protein n=1 Tax=Populus tomentosa TaxID=118781 RepID=A0A8X7YVA2_POPTO|nr:hypothetical protein POTOM_044002 [Populus tomentosa]
MQVLSSILLAILLLFGAFGPGARTCYAVRYLNEMEHSRIGLRAFEKRDIPAAFGTGARTCYAVRYLNKMEHSRMGLRAFEKRRIPARVGNPAPDPNTMNSQATPPPGAIS